MADYATLSGGDSADLTDATIALTAPSSTFDALIRAFGGSDTDFAGASNDVVADGEGNEMLNFGAGADPRNGGGGDDGIIGGLGLDTLTEGDGSDMLFGSGMQRLPGNDGADLLDGMADHGPSAGDAGGATLLGGPGNDTVVDGQGRDSFVFESGFGNDVVLDFERGVDTLYIQSHINGLNVTQPSDLSAYISGTATATITLGSDTIRLTGISKADLLANLETYVKIV